MQHNDTPALKIRNFPEISKNVRYDNCLYKILACAV